MRDPKQMAEGLRKLANDLRACAEQVDVERLKKSAQVLVAARGLVTLEQMLKGAPDAQ